MTSTSNKKRLRVVAAIILDNKGNFFSAERDYGFLKGLWEFPGGKIKENETGEEAIKREIQEELETDINVTSFFMNLVYEYPEFILDMDVYLANVKEGRLGIVKGIHSAERWTPLKEAKEEDYCPADKLIVRKILETPTLFIEEK